MKKEKVLNLTAGTLMATAAGALAFADIEPPKDITVLLYLGMASVFFLNIPDKLERHFSENKKVASSAGKHGE